MPAPIAAAETTRTTRGRIIARLPKMFPRSDAAYPRLPSLAGILAQGTCPVLDNLRGAGIRCRHILVEPRRRRQESLSMVRHPDPEVLVVGAGPVGLVAALFLEQYGVR